MSKNCVACKHFDITPAFAGYSEYTPGHSFRMDCAKAVWDWDEEGTQQHFYECLNTAEHCELFELADYAKRGEA